MSVSRKRKQPTSRQRKCGLAFFTALMTFAVASWISQGYVSGKGGHRASYSTEPVLFCLFIAVFSGIALFCAFALWREMTGRPLTPHARRRHEEPSAAPQSDER